MSDSSSNPALKNLLLTGSLRQCAAVMSTIAGSFQSAADRSEAIHMHFRFSFAILYFSMLFVL